MDFRAVLIFLCLHIAQASCLPVSPGAVNATIHLMRGEIESALKHLAEPNLPNLPCASLNATELLGPEQQQLRLQLPSISCYLVEISKVAIELSTQLNRTNQYIKDVELLTSGQMVKKNCSLPSLREGLEGYVDAKCLLQIVHERLGKAEF